MGASYSRVGTAYSKADTWFLGMYNLLAEHWPTDGEAQAENDLEHIEVTIPDHALLQLPLAIIKDGTHVVPKRTLNPGKFEDLYQLHCLNQGPAHLAHGYLSLEAVMNRNLAP